MPTTPTTPPTAMGTPPPLPGQEGQLAQGQPVQETPVEPTLTQRQRENPDDPTLSAMSDIGGAVANANTKVKKLGKKWKDIPKEMAPRWEMLVTESSKGLKIKHDIIKTVIGDKPYQGLPLDEGELQIRYFQIRDDLELQTQALEANTVKTKDGRLLIKKDYLKTILDLEKKIREGKFNVAE